MKNRFSRYDPQSYNDIDLWRKLCVEGRYKKVRPSELNGLIPGKLLNKTNSALLMASASASPSATVYLLNINRIDCPASAVDQEPYLLVFYHETSDASGCFIHHGDWAGRTTKMDEDFFKAIKASGMDCHYPLKEMPISDSGLLDALECVFRSKLTTDSAPN